MQCTDVVVAVKVSVTFFWTFSIVAVAQSKDRTAHDPRWRALKTHWR